MTNMRTLLAAAQTLIDEARRQHVDGNEAGELMRIIRSSSDVHEVGQAYFALMAPV